MEKGEKKCIVCNEVIRYATNTHVNHHTQQRNAVTCGRRCAKIYWRVNNYISTHYRRELVKKNKILKEHLRMIKSKYTLLKKSKEKCNKKI